MLLKVLNNAEIAGRNRQGLIRGSRALSEGVVGSSRKRIFQVLYEAGLDLEGAEVVEQGGRPLPRFPWGSDYIFSALPECGAGWGVSRSTVTP
jgi:hypothetical protein